MIPLAVLSSTVNDTPVYFLLLKKIEYMKIVYMIHYYSTHIK